MARRRALPGRTDDVRHQRDAPTCVPPASRCAGSKGSGRRSARRPARFTLETPLLGFGNLANVLAATAVAVDLDVPLDAIAATAAHAAAGASPRRAAAAARRRHADRRFLQLEPRGAEAVARDRLDRADGSARKIAVLGEMLELGDACGHAASASAGGRPPRPASTCCSTVGGDAASAAGRRPRRAAGMPSAQSVVAVAGRDEAASEVLKRVRPGDLVLVKGSRGIGLEPGRRRLKAEFA